MPKDQGKFDFSCHDPFKSAIFCLFQFSFFFFTFLTCLNHTFIVYFVYSCLFCDDIKAEEIILSHALRAATSLELLLKEVQSFSLHIKQCRNGIYFLMSKKMDRI